MVRPESTKAGTGLDQSLGCFRPNARCPGSRWVGVDQILACLEPPLAGFGQLWTLVSAPRQSFCGFYRLAPKASRVASQSAAQCAATSGRRSRVSGRPLVQPASYLARRLPQRGAQGLRLIFLLPSLPPCSWCGVLGTPSFRARVPPAVSSSAAASTPHVPWPIATPTIPKGWGGARRCMAQTPHAQAGPHRRSDARPASAGSLVRSV